MHYSFERKHGGVLLVQLKIAFLDEEEVYLEQLKGYLIRRNEVFFKVLTFSRVEIFLEKEQEEMAFDAVVMTLPFWEELKGHTFCSKKILLCEGEREAWMEDCLSVSKYQSAENLFRQISSMLWKESEEQTKRYPEHTAELIGIYSPVHHESQMVFSMTMAQILGESQKVLYINLMEHSGFYQLVNEEITEDIGDLIYGMMQEGHDFAAGLHRIRKTYRNFDYIPPVVNPEHLSEISKTLFEQLFMALKGLSGYDVILIDFGMVFLGFAEMIPVFGSFYCLGKEGMVNRYRIEEFLEYLKKEGEHTMAHMHRLLLPERIAYLEEGSPLDSGLYGGMGDYIRRCLYGGAEIE